MNELLCVALSGEFIESDGRPAWPGFDLSPLEHDAQIRISYLPYASDIHPDHIADIDVLVLLHNRVTNSSFHTNNRLAMITRFGAGYDLVDVDACTKHGVALVTTPGGVKRPMAVAILTLILSMTMRLQEKIGLARLGEKGFTQRSLYMGFGLQGKVLGSIGIGNIGSELIRLARPLDLFFIAYDPYVNSELAQELGVEMVEFDELLSRADILVINCPLTHETHHLIDANAFLQMKPTALLINTARGPIVDQTALTEALLANKIAGAGLDVLEFQPVPAEHPLLQMKNVIITPNALGWTVELCQGNGRGVVQSVQTLLEGKSPSGIINKEVTATLKWQARLRELQKRKLNLQTDRPGRREE